MSTLAFVVSTITGVCSGLVLSACASERRLLNIIKAGAFEHGGKLFSVREVA